MGAAETAFGLTFRAMGFVGRLALAFMAVTITYDAIMRYLFAAPPHGAWSLIVYIAAMTAAVAQRRDDHIRITFSQVATEPL
ncbi:TRAP transporter small permease subunit [Pikeienuella piscinae]|uniref:TRAP transporter small permease subunit n=1 Tax=Pikeienuella piscinae TaxID=2748098 RepID=UPI001BABA668